MGSYLNRKFVYVYFNGWVITNSNSQMQKRMGEYKKKQNYSSDLKINKIFKREFSLINKKYKHIPPIDLQLYQYNEENLFLFLIALLPNPPSSKRGLFKQF